MLRGRQGTSFASCRRRGTRKQFSLEQSKKRKRIAHRGPGERGGEGGCPKDYAERTNAAPFLAPGTTSTVSSSLTRGGQGAGVSRWRAARGDRGGPRRTRRLGGYQQRREKRIDAEITGENVVLRTAQRFLRFPQNGAALSAVRTPMTQHSGPNLHIADLSWRPLWPRLFVCRGKSRIFFANFLIPTVFRTRRPFPGHSKKSGQKSGNADFPTRRRAAPVPYRQATRGVERGSVKWPGEA